MPTLLDPRSQPIDRTAAVRVNAYEAAQEEMRRKLAAEKLAQEHAAAAAARAAAADQRTTSEDTRKAQLPLAAVDAMAWMDSPQYQTPYSRAPIEARQHFAEAYDPSVAAKAPEIWNKAVSDVTGKIPGLDDFSPKQKTVDEKGNVTTTYIPNVDPADNATLTENDRKMAEAIARYDIQPSQALGRFSHEDRKKILALATDLGYDAKEFPARQASRKDFTSGKAAQSITSLNTLIHHFDQVLEAQKKLGNTSIPLLNAPINYTRKNIMGNDAITRFDTNASAVAEEMAKLLKGGVATKGEIDDWKSKLDRNLAPDQLQGNIQEMIRLMAGRVDGLRNQWQSAYDRPREIPFLDADAQKILQKHGFDPADIDPTMAHKSAATAPATPAATPAPDQTPAAPKEPAATKPRVVRQNGVTYTLGEDGQYH